MNAISTIHSQAALHRYVGTKPQPPLPAGSTHIDNPAGAARAALVDRPDLAGKPFGSIVSLFARGLPLPPFENTDPVVPAPE
jgi:hypothetical protein